MEGTTEMNATDPELSAAAVTLVRRWLREAETYPVSGSAAQLAGVLRDPKGLSFAVGFVDGVVRPEDPRVSARALSRLARDVPSFLPAPLRAAVKAGGALAPTMPGVVVPIARRVLREMVGHLIVDATDARLGKAIQKIKGQGVRLNVNLLGEAVLGRGEAAHRLTETERLLARPDVDYVSIKVSATVAPHNPWAFDEAVAHIQTRLTPLFTRARDERKFINLDMEEYKDLDLTIEVFTRLLDRPEFLDLEAGIVLQAYLPDALSAMMRLQEWSAARRARGGAGIKVRLVKGANLPMEQVEASLHGWPLATWGSKVETDTNYKRVLDYALHPDRIGNVRLGVAGHNLFDVAYAWLLAGERGVRDGIEFEMLLGMAQGQAEAVRREVGGLLLYTPVVKPAQFDVAIAYLIRRLEEGASSENFMSAVFDLNSSEALFERERRRFEASLAALDAEVPPAHRVADRHAVVPVATIGHFENTPDTDPSVATNRDWVRAAVRKAESSDIGTARIDAARIDSTAALNDLLEKAGATTWGGVTGEDRAKVLHRVGERIEAHRAALIEVMAAEAGKTADQADPEVSEAVDFAHYYAELARELDDVDGAAFTPAGITLVTPPWNFPVAIPAGGVLAALAAGSAAVLKPAGPAERCGAVLAEAIWEALDDAGVSRDVLTLVQVDEGELGASLIAHPKIDRTILTGAYETAELFRSFRPDLPLLAETSGKNAIIVTPSADLDLAVKDVVHSAFGHAGQKCSAASLVVLVGSVARSTRFRTQLLDAVSSLTVGYPWDPAAQVGPVIEPATGKLLDGLTTLGEGESWLLEPKRLDETGRLWSPGVRDGVRRGSAYHHTEYFGPILGIMTADTLSEAIDIVNEVEYGLTSGIHSLDVAELRTWLNRVRAGNLYVNRGTTGAIVRRQPFGGWKRSSVGPGTKAGGPNYLIGLGDWASRPAAAVTEPSARVRNLLGRAKQALSGDDAAYLERAARSDAEAWAGHFAPSDVSGLAAERNVLRYLPVPVELRLEAGGSVAELVRLVVAGTLAGADLTVSTAVPLPEALGIAHTVEPLEAWTARLGPGRARLVGGSVPAVVTATGGRPDLAVYGGPVTESGRIELLPFLREQAVSITAHRFGNPDGVAAAVL
ncbi:bifunctional proline dehydrogenase/L-glutamate gamma-semialdehyde dehydrogenase [Catenuloplanes atrovinosus]|uniref:L-glutamate gamma-semialdehyde dehydrogenase n=1 Tax=Catenuloplanes atrovinosus TaxID=137266 RepID=A0AAE4CA32_9ACTN|nr:bifunctional proline dehydrogenase/L-glutamate gamma-semialdehyde dehydrogenase [Catenuloplanes atrovinosus]MDR7276643.1 RHH-type proline utilization regulon transcriptional repressor/proline dehydrogenase/delta 1-pyrroline-5-carboxylate dehydrogenase [Catenuloplanes atrovinosus]